jgi:hypothetical protein
MFISLNSSGRIQGLPSSIIAMAETSGQGYSMDFET